MVTYKVTDRDPDLRFDSIGALAPELLDAQVLLDLLEEYLHLPAIEVQHGNQQGWGFKVFG